MAPHYERARVLHDAIEIAVEHLQEPIRRVVVSRGTVTCWGSTMRITMGFYYQNAYSAEGDPMPGSGSWKFKDARRGRIGLLRRFWLGPM
jgi:hypothetical protein